MTGENESAASAPHATSMVVWDVPSPAAVDAPAAVKVGVQCIRGCCLAGLVVEVRDQAGAVLGAASLGSEVSPGTEGLYWTEVTFVAAAATGVAFLSARFAATNLEVPHLDAATSFSLRVDAPPECQVAVRVDHLNTSEPIERVEVRLDHYAAYTDARGEARFRVPAGRYTCSIRRMGYHADAVEIDVTADVAIQIKAGKGETREELEARLSAWENYPWS